MGNLLNTTMADLILQFAWCSTFYACVQTRVMELNSKIECKISDYYLENYWATYSKLVKKAWLIGGLYFYALTEVKRYIQYTAHYKYSSPYVLTNINMHLTIYTK